MPVAGCGEAVNVNKAVNTQACSFLRGRTHKVLTFTGASVWERKWRMWVCELGGGAWKVGVIGYIR